MASDWIPVAGDIITPVTPRPFYVGHRRMELRPGMLLTVLYSEDSAHGTNSHNVDVYHPDFGKHPMVFHRNYWKIVNRNNEESK